MWGYVFVCPRKKREKKAPRMKKSPTKSYSNHWAVIHSGTFSHQVSSPNRPLLLFFYLSHKILCFFVGNDPLPLTIPTGLPNHWPSAVYIQAVSHIRFHLPIGPVLVGFVFQTKIHFGPGRFCLTKCTEPSQQSLRGWPGKFQK